MGGHGSGVPADRDIRLKGTSKLRRDTVLLI